MLELVFVVCLKADPLACEERRQAYLDGASATACLLTAQPQLAAWAEAHPAHRVAGWRCVWRDPDARDA